MHRGAVKAVFGKGPAHKRQNLGAALVVAGIVMGIVKRVFFPHIFNIQTDTLLLNISWAVFSLIVLIAITIPEIPRVVRLVRGQILTVRGEPYVEAALALGTPLPLLLWLKPSLPKYQTSTAIVLSPLRRYFVRSTWSK